MGKAIKLLVYIPALNEESHIEHVIRQIPKSIDGIHSVDSLVIDDGSSDNTAGVAISAGAHVISHGRNQGVGMAFQSAVQFAWANDYAILVGIDADGQFNPAEIPMLIQPLLDNRADMVVGNRFTQGRPEYMPPIKFRGNRMVAALVSSISGQKFQDVVEGKKGLFPPGFNQSSDAAFHRLISQIFEAGFHVFDHSSPITNAGARFFSV